VPKLNIKPKTAKKVITKMIFLDIYLNSPVYHFFDGRQKSGIQKKVVNLLKIVRNKITAIKQKITAIKWDRIRWKISLQSLINLCNLYYALSFILSALYCLPYIL